MSAIDGYSFLPAAIVTPSCPSTGKFYAFVIAWRNSCKFCLSNNISCYDAILNYSALIHLNSWIRIKAESYVGRAKALNTCES